jgi:hypothetical protein
VQTGGGVSGAWGGEGVVGGGGGNREDGRKIWFLAQVLDRASPGVCVCVCERAVICADGG